jgi:hypothetical protein
MSARQTDLGNVPMAAAFTRAGWVNFQRSISMTWPSGCDG